jgi:hypothetical protein
LVRLACAIAVCASFSLNRQRPETLMLVGASFGRGDVLHPVARVPVAP